MAEIKGAGDETIGVPTLYSSGVEGCRCIECTLIVRLDGRRVGNRGDRKGEAGAEIGTVLFLVPAGTFKLKFLALRGRFGGDDERCCCCWFCVVVEKGSSMMVPGEMGVQDESG